MLQISIHRDNNLAAGFVETRGKRGSLTEIPPQSDDFEVLIGLYEIGEELEAPVRRSVIDEYNFVRAPDSEQYRRQPIVERQNGMLFVMNRNDRLTA